MSSVNAIMISIPSHIGNFRGKNALYYWNQGDLPERY